MDRGVRTGGLRYGSHHGGTMQAISAILLCQTFRHSHHQHHRRCLYNGDTAVSRFHQGRQTAKQRLPQRIGMDMRAATDIVISKLDEMGIGKRKVNYTNCATPASAVSATGASPSRSCTVDGVPYAMDEKGANLPSLQQLPTAACRKYTSRAEGEGPLANVTDWVYVKDNNGVKRVKPTPCPAMPAAAGIFCAIWIHIMSHTFADRKAT
jgi:hypothetical protein